VLFIYNITPFDLTMRLGPALSVQVKSEIQSTWHRYMWGFFCHTAASLVAVTFYV